MSSLFTRFSLFVVVAVGLSACGGGGGSSGNDSSSDGSGVVGWALKGAIDGGTVTCFNADGSVKQEVTTNSDGSFKLKEKCPSSGKLVVRSGIDKSTGEEVEELSASGDSTYITPLTTMQKVIADSNIVFGSSQKAKNDEFLSKSNKTDLTDSNDDSKKLVKAGLVLHSLVKNLQQQSSDDLSYAEAMELVSTELKDDYIGKLGSDSSSDKIDAEAMIDKILGKGNDALAKKMDIIIPPTNITALKKMIGETNSSLQIKDKTEGSLKDNTLIPDSLRSGLGRGYISITKETLNSAKTDYILKFTKSSKVTTKTDLSYKCKLFEKKTDFPLLYRRDADWEFDTINSCAIDTDFSIPKINKGKYLVIKYSKGNKVNYSAPYKIGSMINSGTNRELKFADGKVYLPNSSGNTWQGFDIATSSTVSTSSNMGYLPKGFYYKVATPPTTKFINAIFGVKLAIGSQNIIMLADRLYIKDNAIKSSHSNNSNPYLHSVDSTSSFAGLKSFYYYNTDGTYIKKSLSSLDRTDFNMKKSYLRFKKPSVGVGDVLELNTQTALSGDLVGVSLADLCNVEIGLGTATMCDYIRSTINAQSATQVGVTAFIKATNRRGNDMSGNNVFTTNQPVITIRGVSDFATFPKIMINGNPDSSKKTIAGQEGLKGIDSDGDGVSDWWEMKLGRNPFKKEPANYDSDNDGISDIDEIKLGLDPTANSDKITYTVDKTTIDISKGGTIKSFKITFTNNGSALDKIINITLTGNGHNAFSLDVATGTDIKIGVTKTITITPKDNGNHFYNVNKPKIIINAKIRKDSFEKSLGQKQISITSDEFVDLRTDKLKPTGISFTYKDSEGNPLKLRLSALNPGVEITAVANPPTGLLAGATAQYIWQKTTDTAGIYWRDISGATSAKYVVKLSDIDYVLRVRIAYKTPLKPTNWNNQRIAKVAVYNFGGGYIHHDYVSVPRPKNKPTIASDETTNTKIYPLSVMTIGNTSKHSDYTIRYIWQKQAPGDTGDSDSDWKYAFSGVFFGHEGVLDYDKNMSSSYSIPADTPVGTKFRACYYHYYSPKKSGSLDKCSDKITLEARPAGQSRPKFSSITFKTGDSSSDSAITKFDAFADSTSLTYKVGSVVKDSLYAFVELPSAVATVISPTQAKLILTDGTNDITIPATDEVAENIFKTANKSYAVFKLTNLSALKAGKTYNIKRVYIPAGISYALPTSKPSLEIEFKGWKSGNDNGGKIKNNKAPYRATLGDILTAVDTSVGGLTKSYQWQSKSADSDGDCSSALANNTGWADISSATNATYTVANTDIGKCVRVAVALQANNKPTTKTYKAIISVSMLDTAIAIAPATPTNPPVLTSNETPTNTKFYRGSIIQMATSSAPYIASADYVSVYKWQKSFGSAYTNIIGQTKPQYTVPNTFVINDKIKGCYAHKKTNTNVVSNFNCTTITVQQKDSESATLKPTSVTLTYKDSTGGSSITATATNIIPTVEITATATAPTTLPSGASAQYMWQYSPDNGTNWHNINNQMGASYVIKNTDITYKIRALVAYKSATKQTNWNNKTVSAGSNEVTIKQPKLTSNQDNYYQGSTLTIGSTTVKPNSASYTVVYKWYKKLAGGAHGKISGASEETYTIPSATTIGTKIKGCYQVTNNGKSTPLVCSPEVTILPEPDALNTDLKPKEVGLSYKSASGDKITLSFDKRAYLYPGAEITALATPPVALLSGAIIQYKWEKSKSVTNWLAIAEASSNKYVVKLDDVGYHIRATVAYKTASNKSVNWKNGKSKSVSHWDDFLKQYLEEIIRPPKPSAKPILTSSEANGKYYAGSVITASGMSSPPKGYTVKYSWRRAGLNPISTGAPSYTIPSSTAVGKKFRLCYQFTRNGINSLSTCTDDITVESK